MAQRNGMTQLDLSEAPSVQEQRRRLLDMVPWGKVIPLTIAALSLLDNYRIRFTALEAAKTATETKVDGMSKDMQTLSTDQRKLSDKVDRLTMVMYFTLPEAQRKRIDQMLRTGVP